MARGKITEDLSTLQMALLGYQLEKQRIETKIGEIQAMLKGTRAPSSTAGEPQAGGVKRVLSQAARNRIAAAQKKRWAEHRNRVALVAAASA